MFGRGIPEEEILKADRIPVLVFDDPGNVRF